MDINAIITTITEYLPVVGVVTGGLIVAVVAVLRAVAAKKGEDNTNLDEVADKLEAAGGYVADLTDGNPDIDPTNGK